MGEKKNWLSDNFYKKPSGEEKISHEEARIKELDHMSDVARSCMETEAFAKYKRQYQALEEKTIDSMLKFTHNYFQTQTVSIETYGAMMLKYTIQLNAFRSMIEQVESKVKIKKDVKNAEVE